MPNGRDISKLSDEELLKLSQEPTQFGRFGGGITRGAGAGGAVPVPSPLEARIARRPDILQQAGQAAGGVLEQFRKTPFRAAVGLEPKARFGMPLFQAAGGLAQRGLAVPSNIAAELQAGRISPLGLGKAGFKGLTGERLGDLGDIARRVGWPEPIAATLGFFASMGGINLATKGKLIESTRKAGQFVTSKMPKVMGKDYLINRAKVASGGLDDLYEGLTQQYDDVYNAIGNRTVNISAVQDIADDLPTAIVNKINKSNLIQKMPDGSVAPTINNMKVIKNILQKALPKNVLSGRQQADIFQGNLKLNLGKVRDVMAEGNPELVALNRRYADFMKLRGKVGGIIWDKFGDPKSGGLATLFKPGAERARQVAFEDFSRLWPQGQQIMKDAAKYSTRQTLKMLGRRGAMIYGGYELGRKALRPLLGGFGDSGGGFEGGGY